jgi:hypothetical protein
LSFGSIHIKKFFIPVFLLLPSFVYPVGIFLGKWVGVIDGDTITVMNAGRAIRQLIVLLTPKPFCLNVKCIRAAFA